MRQRGRLRPLEPIFKYEPRRGSVAVGNSPGGEAPPALVGLSHYWDFSYVSTLTTSGGGTQVAQIEDVIGGLPLVAPNNDPVISSLWGHQCVESYGDRGSSDNTNAVMTPVGGNIAIPDVAEPCTFAIVFARDFSGLGGDPIAFWGTGTAFDLTTLGGSADGPRIDISTGGMDANVLFVNAFDASNTVVRTAAFDEVLACVIVFNGASSKLYINGVDEHTFNSGGHGIKALTLFNTTNTANGHDLKIGEVQIAAAAEPDPAGFSLELEAKWTGVPLAYDVQMAATTPVRHYPGSSKAAAAALTAYDSELGALLPERYVPGDSKSAAAALASYDSEMTGLLPERYVPGDSKT